MIFLFLGNLGGIEMLLMFALVIFFSTRNRTQNDKLSPFEFGDLEKKQFNGLSSARNMEPESALFYLLLITSIYIVLNFALKFYSTVFHTADIYTTIEPVYKILGVLSDLLRIWICFSIIHLKWRNFFLILSIVEFFNGIYLTFIQN